VKFAVLALLGLAVHPALAQEDSGNGPRRAPPRWIEVDPVPQGWLTDVFFRDEKTGWLLSSEGAVFSTSDGGCTWTGIRAAAPNEYCGGLWFLDAKHGFVISGLRATCDWSVPAKLIETKDGGLSWKDRTPELPDGSRGAFDRIQFVSPTEGFIFGRQLLATRDAGKTWTAVGPEGLSLSGHRSCFSSAKSGWTLNDGELWRTEDGGATWQLTRARNALSEDERLHGDLSRTYFPDGQFGWVLSAWGRILRTQDGGQSWKVLEGFRDERVGHLVLLDARNAWALVEHTRCARGSRLLRTTDGGRTWTESLRSPRRLQRIFFLRPDLGWAVGDGALLRIDR
jgi:photosystem II stability/assembly factor-like uncharacterized protein